MAWSPLWDRWELLINPQQQWLQNKEFQYQLKIWFWFLCQFHILVFYPSPFSQSYDSIYLQVHLSQIHKDYHQPWTKSHKTFLIKDPQKLSTMTTVSFASHLTMNYSLQSNFIHWSWPEVQQLHHHLYLCHPCYTLKIFINWTIMLLFSVFLSNISLIDQGIKQWTHAVLLIIWKHYPHTEVKVS